MKEQKNLEIRKLVLARALYLHGCSRASCEDSVSRMLAIHHFDNSVEMILKCVATKRGITPRGQYFNFEELLKEVSNLPLKEKMRELHRVRNMVQHQGDIPSTESVIKYKGYTEDFLRAVCTRVFKIPYKDLFLSQLIEHENLRKQVLQAEKSFHRQEFKRCIELCNNALMSATFDEADVFYAAGVLTGYWGASDELKMVLRNDYAEKYREKDYYELAKELRGAILQWGQAATGMQFLGEHRMNFLKHRRIVETLERLSIKELRDSAEFSIDFVTSLILKWEEEGVFKRLGDSERAEPLANST